MRKDVSLNNYPRILFSLDMTTVYHPAYSKERCGKKTKPIFFTGKHYNHFIFLNAYINQNCTATNKPSYVRIHKHKYKNLELFDQNEKKKYSIPGDDEYQ